MFEQLNLFASIMPEFPPEETRTGFSQCCYTCQNLNMKKKKVIGMKNHLIQYGCLLEDYVPGAVPKGKDYCLCFMGCGGYMQKQ